MNGHTSTESCTVFHPLATVATTHLSFETKLSLAREHCDLACVLNFAAERTGGRSFAVQLSRLANEHSTFGSARAFARRAVPERNIARKCLLESMAVTKKTVETGSNPCIRA